MFGIYVYYVLQDVSMCAPVDGYVFANVSTF